MENYNEFAPVPWWAWSGWMKKSEMRRQLKLMKKSGIDQFFIYASYGLMHPAFLSDDWWDYIGFTIDECRKLGMKVWIYDDVAWPSGTAAGHVLREHPEHRCRLITSFTKDIPAGGSFIYTGGDMPVELLICDNDQWLPIQLDKNKQWQNNTGKVTRVYCFDIKFYNGVELGSMRASGTWKQRGYINMLDEEAVKCWMQYIYVPYKEKFGDEFGKTIKGFFFDEPTITPYNAYFSAAELMFFGQGPCVAYTPGLFEKFKERYGYDLPGNIHSLFYNTPESAQVRSDYWTLASGCMSVAFGKTVSQWCTDNGLMLTGHSNAEEPINYRNRVYTSGEIWEMQKYQHIPGADVLFYRTPFRGNPDLPMPGYGRNYIYNVKLPPAIARYSGATRTMVEAFGVRGGNCIMAEQKDINNFLAAMGVNFVNDNTLLYSMSPVCGGKSFTLPWFKHYRKFYDASSRLSRFAAFGRLDADVAVLSPETACRAGAPMSRDLPFDTSIGKAMIDTLYGLVTSQVDFELIFEEVIADSPVSGGVLAAPESAFKVIVLPAAKVLPESVAEKLVAFCQQGGKIICTGCRPEKLDHRPLNEAEKRCFDQQLLLTDDESLITALPQAVRKITAAKYQLKGSGIDKVVTALRKCGDEYKLMLSNQSDTPVKFTLDAPVIGDCQAMDPDSGKYWNLPKNRAGEFCLELFPEQSVILEKSSAVSRKPVYFGIPSGKITPAADPQWHYELSTPNCVACKFEISPAYGKMADDPSLLREWIPVDRSGLQDFLLFSPTEYPWYWIRCEFEIDGDIPADLKLIMPGSEYRQVILNGEVIDQKAKPCCLYNPYNQQLDIAGQVRQGRNTMLIKVRTLDWYNVSPMRNEMPTFPPLVLTGWFAADVTGSGTRLYKLPEYLTAGDIAGQGLPQYCGEITFYQEIPGLAKCRKIKINPLRCGSLELLVNDRNCGIRAWEPYIFDCRGKFNADSSKVAFKLTTGWGNLLPGGYGGRTMPDIYGFREIEFFEN